MIAPAANVRASAIAGTKLGRVAASGRIGIPAYRLYWENSQYIWGATGRSGLRSGGRGVACRRSKDFLPPIRQDTRRYRCFGGEQERGFGRWTMDGTAYRRSSFLIGGKKSFLRQSIADGCRVSALHQMARAGAEGGAHRGVAHYPMLVGG